MAPKRAAAAKGRDAATKKDASPRVAVGRTATKEASARVAVGRTAKKEAGKRKANDEAAPPAKRAKTGGGKGKAAPDACIPNRESYKVYEDYNCKLNQTNIDGNNNKFYVIQVLEKGGQYFSWNRWGRVGEPGQKKLEPTGANVAGAIKLFESKFSSKTKNKWANRDSFAPVKGFYTLVDMDEGEDAGGESAPLGKLSQSQIEKGMGVLKKIEAALKSSKGKAELTSLSSNFFSLIPTNFGRKKPEPILTEAQLREKEELLKFWLRMGFEEECADTKLTPISGIMDLPLPASLKAAAGSCCAASAITTSADKGDELAKKQVGKPKKKMEGSLYGALLLYTSNAIYQQLNKTLRDKNRTALKKYFPYLRLLFESMGALSEKKCTLWRGLPVDLYDQYDVGSVQTWWNVSSCTSDVNVAKNFMKSCGGQTTLLTIEAKTACDISQITFYSNEKESLLAPGTQLKVKSRKKTGKLTEITLTEIGRACN